jgi:hypothetical protein
MSTRLLPNTLPAHAPSDWYEHKEHILVHLNCKVQWRRYFCDGLVRADWAIPGDLGGEVAQAIEAQSHFDS